MKALIVGDLHLWDRQIESRVDTYPETCLDKLLQIVKIIQKEKPDCVIQLGDFFHHRVYSNEFKASVNSLIKLSGIPWQCLAGNHLLLYKQLDSVYKSDLGPMIKGAVVSYCGNSYTLREGLIGIESYATLLSETWAGANIIVLHHFINIDESSFHYKFDKDLSFTTTQIREKFPNARWIFAGHDHNTYPTMEVDGFKIVRPGSVMRTSSAKENLSRQVQVALVNFETEAVEYIPLKVSDYSKVFKTEKKFIMKEVAEEVDSFVSDIETVQVSAKEDITEYIESLLAPVDKDTQDEVRSRLRGKGVLA
jgi:DNA repair exonuclease SbcCD nuclease subunit